MAAFLNFLTKKFHLPKYTLNAYILHVQADLRHFSPFLPHPQNKLLLSVLSAQAVKEL